MTKLDMCMFRMTKMPLSSCPWHLAGREGEEGPSADGEGEEGELADEEGEEEVPACR